ncbi:MAG: hypothetical protein IKE35_08075 [Lachnospiraceae bacterium]|nr:hypothetical protein [Lachnospiraceae bacterium]MBR2530961.1 hypothetical protein [Lachnospiraceae bacterium]
MNDYSDIIDHPHHQSMTRPHMSMIARAAQFSPFAALVGYDESVREAGRLTEEKAVLDESALELIDRALASIRAGKRDVNITYFIPDIFKEGGSYTIISGRVRKIDDTEGKIIMEDGTAIPVGDIFEIGFAND